MTATVTVTLKSGPDIANTAIVITEVTGITLDLAREVVQIFKGAIAGAPYKEYDLSNIATLTDTISGGNHAIAMSS